MGAAGDTDDRLRVLVIDDDEGLLRLIRLNLEMDGLEVETASGGEEGLAKAEETLPDAVIVDIMMPNVDGWMVLSELRGRPRTSHVPVMVLTAKSEDKARNTAYRMLAQQFVTKPFDPRDLAPMVRAMAHAKPDAPSDPASDAPSDLPRGDAEPVVTARAGDRTVLIPAHEISAIQRTGQWSEIRRGRDVFRTRATLLELERCLVPAGFARVHRSWLVRTGLIRELVRAGDGTHVVLSTPDSPRIPVSRRKLAVLVRQLGISRRA